MSPTDKPLVWLDRRVSTPPVSEEARREIGHLLRRLQHGEDPVMPWSRPMPAIGPRCHELRVNDGRHAWRLAYRLDWDNVVVATLFDKKTQKTPHAVIFASRQRLKRYDQRMAEGENR